MRIFLVILTALALLLGPALAEARGPKVHVVASGHTLGKIARRYNVSIDALCTANGIRRNRPLRIGQRLVIPDRDDRDGKRAAQARQRQAAASDASPDETGAPPRQPDNASTSNPSVLDVPNAPPAYYYPPTGPGRLSLRPVLFFLHGRGGDPASACRRWAAVARSNGWLVCPTGPEVRPEGGRGWANNWASARQIVLATLSALRARYGRRVQLYGNTLVGFSEGAYVAMNVGLREPRTFNRWLILAANDQYWGSQGLALLRQNRGRVRRVYLITGGQDEVLPGTHQVLQWLRQAGVPTRIDTPEDMGHETPVARKAALYARALRWLQRG